jgi:eukaryotic-like serine/threonine-protein kinase
MKSAVDTEEVAGRYRIAGRIASGGMGEVFRARDSVLGRTVAIKMLAPGLASRPGFVERFRAEAQAAARLSHPNVVQIHDWGETGATYFMVMEYVRGKNLREILAAHGPLEPRQAAEVAHGILLALAAAHSQGLVHRDVKPENVLVTADGVVKVADFGIARALEDASTTSGLIGTVAYAAPEQAAGGEVDGRADLYSAGCVLFEMLTGSPPFEGDVAEVLNRHLNSRVGAPSLQRPEAAPLNSFVARLTEPKPGDRYASAREALNELEAAERGLPPAAPLAQLTTELTSVASVEGQPTLVPGGQTPRKKKWWLAAILLPLLLIAGAVAAWARPVRVPVSTGKDLAQARKLLTAAGFNVRLDYQTADEPAGTVLGTKPSTGSLARRGSTVVIEVSKGPPLTDVPNVVGMTADAAKAAITQASLIVGEVTEKYASDPAGKVIAQDPAPGRVRKQTPVNLVVSKGPEAVAVPDVKGKTFDDAQAALTQAGLTATREDVFNDAAPGKVVDQSPQAGAKADKGSQVKLTVSKGSEPFAMPDEQGKSCADGKADLESRGLVVSVNARSGTCASNKVLAQDPLPGSTVRKGDQATLYAA